MGNIIIYYYDCGKLSIVVNPCPLAHPCHLKRVQMRNTSTVAASELFGGKRSNDFTRSLLVLGVSQIDVERK